MSNLIRGEFYKIIKCKGSRLALILSVLFGIGTYLFIKMYFTISGQNPEVVNGVVLFRKMLSEFLFANFLFSVLAAEFVAKDFESYTINKSFSYGYSRAKIIISKFIVFFIGSVILGGICTIFAIVPVTLEYGFGTSLSIDTMLNLIRNTCISLVCSSATASITCMIAIISSNIPVTMLAPLGLFIINVSMDFIYRPLKSVLPFNIGEIAMSQGANNIDIGFMILSCCITFIITIGGTLFYLNNKDIK